MRLFLFTLLLLSSFLLNAQGSKLELKHHNAIVFYDYLDHCFYALDDSTFIWRFNEQKRTWQKAPIILNLEIPFKEFLKDFVPLSEKKTPTYFVYRGCGIVYKKNGIQIARHDNSFKHENQFNGSFFMLEGVPHIYGGYGLFTAKNIITRYDTIIGEWYLVDAKGKCPPVGCFNLIFKDGGNLIVFEGYKLQHNKFWNELEGVYRFNTKLGTWKRIGLLNNQMKSNRKETPLSNQVLNNNALICFGNYLISYNTHANTYVKYKLASQMLYRKAIRAGDKILFLMETQKPSFILEISNQALLKKFSIQKGNIYYTPKRGIMLWITQKLWIILMSAILLGFFFLWTKYLFFRFQNMTHNNSLKIKNYKIGTFDLSDLEKRLLELFIQNRSGLEISSINDLVNYDDPSIDTLKKRREILLRDLRSKLSFHYNIPAAEIFIEQRMETDKRMKLIFLNPEIATSL